jgi:hypothetical protein
MSIDYSIEHDTGVAVKDVGPGMAFIMFDSEVLYLAMPQNQITHPTNAAWGAAGGGGAGYGGGHQDYEKPVWVWNLRHHWFEQMPASTQVNVVDLKIKVYLGAPDD